ncbi:MAG: GAF domain-containing protein, partial [Hyphomicrobiales bacterium]|nr:GAF domain-containing protein [Hyphomicrobiales bacterium]
MTDNTSEHPATDITTLENCHREPIHILGAVQDFGGLIAVDHHLMVRHASTSVDRFFEAGGDALAGKPLAELLGAKAIATIRQRSQLLGPDSVERIFRLPGPSDDKVFSCALYRSGGLLVLELEPSVDDPALEAASAVRTMMARLNSAAYPEGVFSETTRQVRTLTGFDRVMLYKFLPDGSGSVVAESRASHVDSFLGLRYPASDIPSQARELYKRNWLRIIADVDAEPSPILPPRTALGAPIDLSLSVLRSVSPIHIEYLKNMEVKASLSISIVVGSELWGLIACHHYSPRTISFERRTAAEIFGNLLSLLISTREHEAEQRFQFEARARMGHVLARISEAGELDNPLLAMTADLKNAFDCDGIAIESFGTIVTEGIVPDDQDIRLITDFLRKSAITTVFAEDRLCSLIPEAKRFADKGAGAVAIPISSAPHNYILYFRRELKQTVRWGGNPEKPVTLGANGARLTPRESFAEWKETVANMCESWTRRDIVIAEELRTSIHDIILKLTSARGAERARSLERQELLIAELNHRVRNILGLVRSIVRQSRSGAASVEAFANTLFDRIASLSRAHDNINSSGGTAASLESLIQSETEAYLSEKALRVDMDGPHVLLNSTAHSVLSLVLHELVTNAAKYGALSDRHGRVKIVWDAQPGDDLRLMWRETGGPAVVAPMRKGFGSTLINRSI